MTEDAKTTDKSKTTIHRAIQGSGISATQDEVTSSSDDDVGAKLQDIERRLILIDKRFDDTAKRFDDIKWYVTGISSIFTVIFRGDSASVWMELLQRPNQLARF